jgi:glucose dehydrogenase
MPLRESNMSTMYDKIRAMLNGNGRTPEEAEAFRAKAEELIQKHGLVAAFKEKPKKGKAKRAAKPKAAKPVDNRMRQILVQNVMTKRWAPLKQVNKADLAATMKDLRERGYTVKSKVVK